MFSMEKKLKSVGIESPKELSRIIGGHPDLAYKIWRGDAKLSKKRAILIKQHTGASLDYLLG